MSVVLMHMCACKCSCRNVSVSRSHLVHSKCHLHHHTLLKCISQRIEASPTRPQKPISVVWLAFGAHTRCQATSATLRIVTKKYTTIAARSQQELGDAVQRTQHSAETHRKIVPGLSLLRRLHVLHVCFKARSQGCQLISAGRARL